MWPKATRPEILQKKKNVNRMKFDVLMSMYKAWKETESANRGANMETFAKDQRPPKKKFKAEVDDGRKRLHSARFLRQPLDSPKSWWKKVPTVRSHVYKNMSLEFSGRQNCVAEKTIANLHNRTLALTLKHFNSDNVTVSSKPKKSISSYTEQGMTSVFDFCWDEPSTMLQIQDSILNYCFLLHNLWPYDTTGLQILGCLTKYRWIAHAPDMKSRTQIITAFFDTVLRINAIRATNKECIMSAQEQEDTLKRVLIKHGMKPEVPVQEKPKASPSSSTTPRIQQARKPMQERRPPPSVNGLQCCWDFNSLDGSKKCRNSPTSRGCKLTDGRELAHACSAWIPGKKTWCLNTSHPRSKHV